MPFRRINRLLRPSQINCIKFSNRYSRYNNMILCFRSSIGIPPHTELVTPSLRIPTYFRHTANVTKVPKEKRRKKNIIIDEYELLTIDRTDIILIFEFVSTMPTCRRMGEPEPHFPASLPTLSCFHSCVPTRPEWVYTVHVRVYPSTYTHFLEPNRCSMISSTLGIK